MENNGTSNTLGHLSIETYDRTIGEPASGAIVLIRPSSGDTGISAELITDESGQSPMIDLPAPYWEFSFDPASSEQPYAEYDVLITLPGYKLVTINGTQIFSGTQAIQSVYLERAENTPAAERSITIQPNTLWGNFPPKIPENEVKELPPAQGYSVLPNPVIPEYIIVHTGAPTADAQNYWIPFKDYIKNVACCEIYPTWPTETIRANVLAIISFTLNRVYTEWYPAKGFPFTITNSTAYDHAFSYGRNIFTEVSRVVDEIFTTFITRPDIRQPLFTQYCDGKRVQCPNWLSQWGSKSLGDQGYSGIDILKYYYGTDIFLMQAKSVQGVPSSFPGTNLQLGSVGESVRTIQEQLTAISNNYPALPKVRDDGIFGNATLAAVEKFQSIFGLPTSGIVDFPTWYRISDIYVAVTRMAELR